MFGLQYAVFLEIYRPKNEVVLWIIHLGGVSNGHNRRWQAEMTPLQHTIVSVVAVVFAIYNLGVGMYMLKDKAYFKFSAFMVIAIMCIFFAIAHSLKAWW